MSDSYDDYEYQPSPDDELEEEMEDDAEDLVDDSDEMIDGTSKGWSWEFKLGAAAVLAAVLLLGYTGYRFLFGGGSRSGDAGNKIAEAKEELDDVEIDLPEESSSAGSLDALTQNQQAIVEPNDTESALFESMDSAWSSTSTSPTANEEISATGNNQQGFASSSSPTKQSLDGPPDQYGDSDQTSYHQRFQVTPPTSVPSNSGPSAPPGIRNQSLESQAQNPPPQPESHFATHRSSPSAQASNSLNTVHPSATEIGAEPSEPSPSDSPPGVGNRITYETTPEEINDSEGSHLRRVSPAENSLESQPPDNRFSGTSVPTSSQPQSRTPDSGHFSPQYASSAPEPLRAQGAPPSSNPLPQESRQPEGYGGGSSSITVESRQGENRTQASENGSSHPNRGSFPQNASPSQPMIAGETHPGPSSQSSEFSTDRQPPPAVVRPGNPPTASNQQRSPEVTLYEGGDTGQSQSPFSASSPSRQHASSAPQASAYNPDSSNVSSPSHSFSGSRPVAPQFQEYMVQPNDSFWTISEKVYETGSLYKALAEHNRSIVADPSRLKPGTRVEIPPVEYLDRTYPALTPEKEHREVAIRRQEMRPPSQSHLPEGTRFYTVQEGDTLYNIAKYELGSVSRWNEIKQLNQHVLGEDCNYITPGLELVLPPSEQGGASVDRRGGGMLH
jgi:nucleoid-associated protein YgaU